MRARGGGYLARKLTNQARPLKSSCQTQLTKPNQTIGVVVIDTLAGLHAR